MEDGVNSAPPVSLVSRVQWLPPPSSRTPSQEQLDKRLRAAAACADAPTVAALLAAGAQVNAADPKTGWTSAHWACALRRVTILSLLCEYGADLACLDGKGNSVFDVAYAELSPNDVDISSEPTVSLWSWGDSSNYALGRETYSTAHSSAQSPKKVSLDDDKVAELAELGDSKPFLERLVQRNDRSVVAAALSPYHSALLTKSGLLYTWGLGEGGRLGYTADIQTTPKKVSEVAHEQLIQISVTPAMTAVVSLSGRLYMCGTSEHGQFGNGELVSRSSHMTTTLALRGVHVSRVHLSPVHTCVVTADGELYTFGRGTEGQLGHGAFEDELRPRLVPLTHCRITKLACEASLTVLCNSKNDLYWFGLGRAKPSRVKFTWGYPSLHRVNTFTVRSLACATSSFFVLVDEHDEMGSHSVYRFFPNEETSPTWFCAVNNARELHLVKEALYILTESRQIFCISDALQRDSLPNTNNKSDNRVLSTLHRVLTGLRPVALVMGTHHSLALQADPWPSQVEITPSLSSFLDDVERVRGNHATCDVIISAASSPSLSLPAHSFMLRRSPVLSKLLDKKLKSGLERSGKVLLTAEWTPNARSWELLLAYLFSDKLPLADLENAKGLAKALQLPNLCTLLSRRLGLSAGRLDASASLTNFIFANLQQLERTFTADVIITSQGDERIGAHSFVLVERSEYFRRMLAEGSWREVQAGKIDMRDISPQVLRALLVYLYTDELAETTLSELSELFLLADRLLLPHLHDLCAARLLAEAASPLVAFQVIGLLDVCPHTQLRLVNYISLNLELIMRMDLLTLVPPELLDEVEELIHARNFDRSHKFFTEPRQKYLKEYVQNLAVNRRPSEATPPNSPPKAGGILRASSTSPKATTSVKNMEKSPKKGIDKKSEEEVVKVNSEVKPSVSSESAPLVKAAKLTPLQRKQLREKDKPRLEVKEPTLPKEEKKPVWGGVASGDGAIAPSFSEIMREDAKGGRASKKRTPSKNVKVAGKPAWSTPTKPVATPPASLSFYEIQRQERAASACKSQPRPIPQPKPSSPPQAAVAPSPTSSPNASPLSSSAPVVHRHMWGSRSSLPATPAPTLAESSRRIHFQSKPVDLRDIMSEQYIEQILADDKATQS